MKTTLDLNAGLITEAKTLAAQQNTTLTRLIEEGLQLRLHAQHVPRRKIRLPVYRGRGGLQNELNGLSNKALREAADRDAFCQCASGGFSGASSAPRRRTRLVRASAG